MDITRHLIALLFFPGGLFLLLLSLAYEWVHRKLIAQLQNRIGPRWFQPLADTLKLLSKEEIVPEGIHPLLFTSLPVVALAGALTAALYVPLVGLAPAYSFPGDLIVTVYLLSLLTLCLGLAGSNPLSRFSLAGATRTLTQLFSYEAPFLFALLGPAIVAGSWQISEIMAYAQAQGQQSLLGWLVFTQPVGFLVALVGLMGKLELPPFDAPEAETEIVAGALTEYSGRGLALFRLAKNVVLVVGLTLIAAFYLGGFGIEPGSSQVLGSQVLLFFAKTLLLLFLLAGLQALFARLRIDQTVGLWWRFGALLMLLQWFILIVWRGMVA